MTTEQAPEKKASKKRLRSSSEPTIDPPEPTLQIEPNERSSKVQKTDGASNKVPKCLDKVADTYFTHWGLKLAQLFDTATPQPPLKRASPASPQPRRRKKANSTSSRQSSHPKKGSRRTKPTCSRPPTELAIVASASTSDPYPLSAPELGGSSSSRSNLTHTPTTFSPVSPPQDPAVLPSYRTSGTHPTVNGEAPYPVDTSSNLSGQGYDWIYADTGSPIYLSRPFSESGYMGPSGGSSTPESEYPVTPTDALPILPYFGVNVQLSPPTAPYTLPAIPRDPYIQEYSTTTSYPSPAIADPRFSTIASRGALPVELFQQGPCLDTALPIPDYYSNNAFTHSLPSPAYDDCYSPGAATFSILPPLLEWECRHEAAPYLTTPSNGAPGNGVPAIFPQASNTWVDGVHEVSPAAFGHEVYTPPYVSESHSAADYSFGRFIEWLATMPLAQFTKMLSDNPNLLDGVGHDRVQSSDSVGDDHVPSFGDYSLEAS